MTHRKLTLILATGLRLLCVAALAVGLAPEAAAAPVAQAAGDFIDSGIPLTGFSEGSAVWGDYDSDGDLDILLAGVSNATITAAKIYRNDGDGIFTNIGAQLPDIDWGSAAWGDYDNDGDLDILLTGFSGVTRVARVYRNDGSGAGSGWVFTDINAPLTSVSASSAAWGDYDNDGQLDILLTGCMANCYLPTTRIFHNNGGGIFADINASLEGVGNSSVAWSDYNNDGRLDYLVTGTFVDPEFGTLLYSATRVYRNDGDGIFTNIQAQLPGVARGSVAWGDYDNDGRPDILLAGAGITKIYRNEGTDIFTDINAGLMGFSSAAAAWGDYDNDGNADILLTGRGGAKVYRNNGNGTFADVGAGLLGVESGAVAWGDYDNDGDLDILLTGSTSCGASCLTDVAKIYQNNSAIANIAPTAPTGLQALSIASDVVLNWNAAGDAQTSANGLTYNLRVGTIPGGVDLLAPMAEATTGYRRVAQPGNVSHGITATLQNLAPGTTYYWSVQAIDTAFAGSPFATEDSFTTPTDLIVTQSDAPDPVGLGNPLTYTTIITNVGSTLAMGIRLTDTLPLNVMLGSVVSSLGSCNVPGSGLVTCNLLALDGYGSATVTIVVTPTAFGSLTNVVGVTTEVPEATTANNVFTQTTTVSPADLSVTQSDMPDPVGLGNSLTYTIVTTNIGPTSAAGVRLTDTLPVSVTLGSVASSQGNCDVLALDMVMCDLLTLNGYTSATVTVLVTPTVFGSLTNVSSVTTDVPETTTANNTFTQTTTVSPADLIVTQSDTPDPVGLGNPLTYTILITSIVPTLATDVQLTDTLPVSVTLGSVTPSQGSCDAPGSGVVMCNLLTLSGYASATVTIVVTPTAFGNLSNVVNVTTSMTETIIANNTSIQTTTVSPADLMVTQSVTPDPVGLGNPLTYMVTITNIGPTPATRVWLTDTLPVSVTLGSVTSSQGGCNAPDSGMVTCDLLTLDGYAAATVTVVVTPTDVGMITNAVTVTTNMTETTTANNASLQTTGVKLFVNSGSTAVIGLTYSSVAWGDYNNDGQLDILVAGCAGGCGNPVTKVYRNDGNGAFTDINAGLAGVERGSVAWGDYNNDGWIDILVTGLFVSKIYRNDGDGSFTDIGANLTGVANSSAAWGDYDNDGRLDILLTGCAGLGADQCMNPISRIYRNAGSSGGSGWTFTAISAALVGVYDSSVAWGDYNNDGRLDVLLTGCTSGFILYSCFSRVSMIYRNDGGGIFTNIGAVLPAVGQGSAAWGDYDNDGNVDVLLTGYTATNSVTQVYRNEGGGVFADIGAGLTATPYGSVAWGDYDDDGDLDILLTGLGTAKVYRNDGSGIFTDIGAGLTGVTYGSAAWGDYDSDGNLDILLTGEDQSYTAIAEIYSNNILASNTVPSAPTGLVASATGSSVTLTWNAASDAQTPVSGLTYNLRVGMTPGGLDIVSPMSLLNTGFREVPQLGNAAHGTTATVQKLMANAIHYWSVQAVDTSFGGSVFAEEGSFTTPPPTVQFGMGAFSVDENAETATITVTLSSPSAMTVTANYAANNGTALAGSDYLAATGILIFTPGVVTQTFGVPIMDDTFIETSETVILTLSSPANAFLSTPNAATLTIADNDVPLPISDIVTPNGGGAITATSSLITSLFFPPGAVSQPVTVTVGLTTGQPISSGFQFVGETFFVEATDPSGTLVTTFAQPFTIIIHYDDADVTGLDEATLKMYFWDINMRQWTALSTQVDETTNRLTATADHLTMFALLGKIQQRLYLPLITR